MLIKDKYILKLMINDLINFIRKNKIELFELNKKATLDTDHWMTEDYKTIKRYLAYFLENYGRDKLIDKIKSKGRILIMLSYNEPFIMSIVPVLNALVVNNNVLLKPSKKTLFFVKMLWEKSGIIEKYKLNLKIIYSETTTETIQLIKKVDAVYFFGSYKIAQKIFRICAKHYIKFYPEVETADCKIFSKNMPEIKHDAILTLTESFSHSGQICQRIQGIFVQRRTYSKYVEILKQEFLRLHKSRKINKFIDNKYVRARKTMINILLQDIKKAEPDEIVRVNKIPLLVINPKQKSELVQNAYFLPTLWVLPFDSKEELVKILTKKFFLLGLNIQSNNNNFINYIIKNTGFTRYTVNTNHTQVKLREGWGGVGQSGFSGYKSWIKHFSDSYVVIDKHWQ